jgi:hypothetical protein
MSVARAPIISGIIGICSPFRRSVATTSIHCRRLYAFYFLGVNQYGTKIADSLGGGPFQFTDVYNFYRSASNDFRAEGVGFRNQGVPLAAYYSDEDELVPISAWITWTATRPPIGSVWTWAPAFRFPSKEPATTRWMAGA